MRTATFASTLRFGNDTLFGENGNDLLVGGADNDFMVRMGNDDVYVFAPRDGTDTILDFSPVATKTGFG